MKVNWVIENFTKEYSYIELAEAVKKQNYSLIEIKGDYNRELLRPFLDGNRHCVIFNGSIKMAQLVRQQLPGNSCEPVIFCGGDILNNFRNFLCSKYYAHFGDYLFNDKYVMMSLNEFYRQKFFIYGILGKDGLVFIRPDSGEKPFTAQLLDFQDVERFYYENIIYKHELVLVSTPKNIKWEGRFVVNKDKEIIAHSTYRMQGQKTIVPHVPPETLAKCKEILKIGYYPDEVFCIDLCQDNDLETWLLELTSFSSAGLYACNKDKIVTAVSRAAWKKYEEKETYVFV